MMIVPIIIIKCNDYDKWAPIRIGVAKWSEGNKCPNEIILNHVIVHIIVLYILNSVKVVKKMGQCMMHVQEQLK